jgi:cell division protease FtsH
MVTKYGMSDKLGPVALEGSGGSMSYAGYVEGRGYSPEVAKQIDDEVSRIIEEAKQRARDILTKHRKALDAIAKKLMEVETLERDEYEEILKTEGIEIQDIYRDMKEQEERAGDPTKSLEPPAEGEIAADNSSPDTKE